MDDGQGRSGKDEYRAFKDHEGGLSIGDSAKKVASEFDDAVDGEDVDQVRCEGDGYFRTDKVIQSSISPVIPSSTLTMTALPFLVS